MENIRKIIYSLDNEKNIKRIICIDDENITRYSSEDLSQNDLRKIYLECCSNLFKKYEKELEGLSKQDKLNKLASMGLIVRKEKNLIIHVTEYDDPVMMKIIYEEKDEEIKASDMEADEYISACNNIFKKICEDYDIEANNIDELKTQLKNIGIYEESKTLSEVLEDEHISNFHINKRLIAGILGTSALALMICGGVKLIKHINKENKENKKQNVIETPIYYEPTSTPYTEKVVEEPFMFLEEQTPTPEPTPTQTPAPTVAPEIYFVNEKEIFPGYEEVRGKNIILTDINNSMFLTYSEKTDFYEIRNKTMDAIANYIQSNIPNEEKGYYIYFENLFRDAELSDKAFVKYFSMLGNEIIKSFYKDNNYDVNGSNKYAIKSCYEVVRCIRNNEPLSVYINGELKDIYYSDISNNAKYAVLNIAWSNYTVLNSSPDLYKISDLGEEAKIPEIHYNNEIITKSEIADILINAYENLSITK